MTKTLHVGSSELPARRPNNGIENPQYPYQTIEIRKFCKQAEESSENELPEIAEKLAEYISKLEWAEVYTPFENEMYAGEELPACGTWKTLFHKVERVRIESAKFAPHLTKALSPYGITVV